MSVLPRSRARLLFFICLLIAGYFAYTALTGAIGTSRIEGERRKAQSDLLALQDRKAYIEGVREYVSSDQYVEQEARRQLGYVRDGEIPFVVVGPPVDDAEQRSGDWIERLFPR